MKNLLSDLLFAFKIAIGILLYFLFTISCGYVFVLWIGDSRIIDLYFVCKAILVLLFWIMVSIYVLIKHEA